MQVQVWVRTPCTCSRSAYWTSCCNRHSTTKLRTQTMLMSTSQLVSEWGVLSVFMSECEGRFSCCTHSLHHTASVTHWWVLKWSVERIEWQYKIVTSSCNSLTRSLPLVLRSWWKDNKKKKKKVELESKKYVDNRRLKKRATDHPRWRKQKRGSAELNIYNVLQTIRYTFLITLTAGILHPCNGAK